MKGFSLGKVWGEGRLPCETAVVNDNEMKLFVESLRQLVVAEKVLSEENFFDFVECQLPDQKTKFIMLYALLWDLYKLFVAGQLRTTMEAITFPSEQRLGKPLCLQNTTVLVDEDVLLVIPSIVERHGKHHMHSLSLGDDGFSWDFSASDSPDHFDDIYYRTRIVMTTVFEDLVTLSEYIARSHEDRFPHPELRDFWCCDVEEILNSNSPVLEGAKVIDRLQRLVSTGTYITENLSERLVMDEEVVYERAILILETMKQGLSECDMNVSRSMLRNGLNQYWYDVVRDHNGNFMTPEKFWKSVNPRQIAISVKVCLHRPPRPCHLLLSHPPYTVSLPHSHSFHHSLPFFSLFQLTLMMRAGGLDLNNSIPEVTEAIMSEDIFPLSQAVAVVTEQKMRQASLDDKRKSARNAFFVMLGVWMTERQSCLSASVQRGAAAMKSKMTGGARSLKLPPRQRESSADVEMDHCVLARTSDSDDGKSPVFQLHFLTLTNARCIIFEPTGIECLTSTHRTARL